MMSLKCACRYDNTDLVVVLTMIPEKNEDIAGYALSLQYDSWRRTTVGLFNYVPTQIDATLIKEEKNEAELKVCLSRYPYCLTGQLIATCLIVR